jgi:hypothetical protein
VAWRRIKARNAKRILHLQAAADSGDSGDGEGLEGNRVRGGAEPSSPSAEPSAFGVLGVAPVDVALRFAVESAVPSDWRRGGLGPFGPFAAPFGVHAPQRYLTGPRFAALAATCPEWLSLLSHHRPAANHAAAAARASGQGLRRAAPAGQTLGWAARCVLAAATVPCAAAVYASADGPDVQGPAGMAGMAAVPARRAAAASGLGVTLGWGCSGADYPPLAGGAGSGAAAVAARGGVLRAGEGLLGKRQGRGPKRRGCRGGALAPSR